MRKRKLLKVFFIACLILVSTVSPQAYEFLTGRGLGLQQTLLLSEPSASTLLRLSTNGINRREWIVEAGALRKFELKELDLAYLAAATRIGDFVLAAGISQLGQRDFYAEKTLRTSIGYQSRQIGISIFLSGVEYDFGGYYTSLRAAALGAGLSYAFSGIYLGASFDNLNSPTLLAGSPETKPDFSFYGELKGKGAYSILVRVTIPAR